MSIDQLRAISSSTPLEKLSSAQLRVARTASWPFDAWECPRITAALRERRWSDVPAVLLLYRNPGSPVEAGLHRRRTAEGELWHGRGQFASSSGAPGTRVAEAN